MELSESKKQINRRADYDRLYQTAFNYIISMHDIAGKAMSELEEMYLTQTEPIDVPEHLKLADARQDNQD